MRGRREAADTEPELDDLPVFTPRWRGDEVHAGDGEDEAPIFTPRAAEEGDFDAEPPAGFAEAEAAFAERL